MIENGLDWRGMERIGLERRGKGRNFDGNKIKIIDIVFVCCVLLSICFILFCIYVMMKQEIRKIVYEVLIEENLIETRDILSDATKTNQDMLLLHNKEIATIAEKEGKNYVIYCGSGTESQRKLESSLRDDTTGQMGGR